MTYQFVNAGGGCGDPECDYQIQCETCFDASERQYNEWFRRAGFSRSMFRLVIDEMHEQVHVAAIEEDQARAAAGASV